MLLKVFLFSFAALLFTQTPTKQELNDQLFEAVRKGDAAAVTAALDKGADVNAKFRYGSTALFKAAERGHKEVVAVLLARGADVKVKDSFYGATAMTWAVDNNHLEVVRMLLQKSEDEAGDVLMNGVRENNDELVKLALERGGIKAEDLSAALVVTSSDPKRTAATEMLKKAGATPPMEIDAATLQSFAGKYKGDPGPEITVVSKDGNLFATGLGRGELRLMPLDKVTFRPLAFSGVTLTFNAEGGKVVGATLKGQNTTQLKRVE